MAEQTKLATWNRYQDAWSNITAEERERLLRSSLAEDCFYGDPVGNEGKGIAALTVHIEKFQQDFPGHIFVTHKFQEHHGYAIAEWNMYDAAGNAVLAGKSVTRFSNDGLLMILLGFWEQPA
jgi:hypothetical protein